MAYSRSIISARDDATGFTVQAFELFQSHKKAFEARKHYHSGDKSYSCLECGQLLAMATSSRDRLFFRHLPNSDFCDLKDANLSDELLDNYYRTLQDRESDRHKELKHRISKGLSKTHGVVASSIIEDTKFIIKGNERRRPDVYCRYFEKEVVFEIQLSQLSLGYILRRHSFYRKHGIYLFWILDIENPGVQSQMERDIKYLSHHQNLFSLDETPDDPLKFTCAFKTPYIHDNDSVRDIWLRRSIELHEFTFDNDLTQAYYFNYKLARQRKEEELTRFLTDKREKDEELEKIEHVRKTREKIDEIIYDIKELKRKDYSFYNLYERFENMNVVEIELLNNILGLNNQRNNSLPPLMSYIRKYRRVNPQYLDSRISIVEFLITERRILIDVNAKEGDGRGCLQELFENNHLELWMYRILPALFLSGYYLTEYDRKYFKNRATGCDKEDELILLRLTYYNNLFDHSLLPLISKYFKYLIFIESALTKTMIGTRLKSWVQFVAGIQGGYKRFWYYTELSLKKNGTWDLIIGLDKKGTMLKKVKEFNLDNIERDDSIEILLRDLYPELFF